MGAVDTAAPAATARMVSDTVHGITLEDPYRWMEQPDNAEFTSWLQASGGYAQALLQSIPHRDELLQRVREVTLSTRSVGRAVYAGDGLFFLHSESGSPLPRLVVRTPDGGERVLFDPVAARGEGGPHLSIDHFMPSPDGRLVAVGVARGGGEVTRVHVMETATGAMRPDVIEGIWGELAISWLPDASGFLYTQMAQIAGDPSADPLTGMRVRIHRLGTAPEDDPVLLGPGATPRMPIDPHEFPWIEIPRGSGWVLAYALGARAEVRLCVARVDELRGTDTPWCPVAEYDDQVEIAAVHGDDLYLLSTKDAPNRRVLHVPLAEPALAEARVVVPEREERVLTSIAAARDALYLVEMDRGNDRVSRMDYAGGAPREVVLPIEQCSVGVVAAADRDGVMLAAQGWTQPRTWYAFDPAGGGTLRDMGLGTLSPADFSAITVESVDVESHDGVRVPLTLLYARGLARDGSHPAILHGYGAYGYSVQPAFQTDLLPWLEHGGVFAVCHARGGGEKGRSWYLAGTGAHKRNAVADFIACAEYLAARGYTSAAHLGAWSSSMGGVLVGGAITERPDAFAAAVVEVGVLNPVRFLEGVNGANQISELGDPATEEGYRALAAMDPYHHVRPGVSYPAVMLQVGLNDGRVSAWHSGKFAARVQAATSSGRPVLIRIDDDAGHGIGSTREQRAQLQADTFGFLLWQLGHPDFQPAD
ncbi:MAG TPA: prolyl oligopeptidase family serine peptidase [Longimicrobium sp.]|nr:prolyl oligopeptidase family serine peptidase [Longimicrobium sp.]